MGHGERGFTLIETVVGAAIACVVIWSLLALVTRTRAASERLSARADAQSRANRLEERLESEASSAWAVFIPARDVLGADDADGHELDLFTEDASHRPSAWAYRYDTSSHRLARYAYAPGIAPVETESLGSYDAFAAHGTFSPSALADASSAAYDPLFATASVPFVTHAFAEFPGALGGNGIVTVALRAPGVERTLTLASATAPSAFTIVLRYTPSPAPSATPPLPLPTLTASATATP
ncbi:MAG: type II secretion system protein [bacterium]|nr:type II secretion system protein [bacterium]